MQAFCLRSASLICTLGLLLFLHDKASRVVLGGPMEVPCRTGQKWMQRLPWSLHLLGAGCIHPPNINSAQMVNLFFNVIIKSIE